MAFPSARESPQFFKDVLAVEAIKNYPQLLGEAKVREIDNWKNPPSGFFYLFSDSCKHKNHCYLNNLFFANNDWHLRQNSFV